MNAEDLQSPGGIRYPNVHLSVKVTKSPEGGVNAIGTVGGCHDNNMGLLLPPIYKGQELGHDSSLRFTMGLLSLWCDAIQLIMKAMAGAFFSASSKAFLRLLSGSPAILLIISGELMRKKKAPVSLATAQAIRVLPVPGGPYKRMPRLNSDSLKQLWVSK